MKAAWLIGAGFSFELGMPLVWPLTNEIKRWLTRAKLNELNAGWTRQRASVHDSVIAAACDRLEHVEETYEQLIGWFQTQRETDLTGTGPIFRGYQHLEGLVQAAVGEILFRRHAGVAATLPFMLPWYRGMERAIPPDGPLWVFSLNHDLCVETIAGDLSIPVSCGYPDQGVVSFLTRTGRPVTFDRLPNERLVAHDFDFATGRAINLVKLHGSLDVFWYGDGRDFVRVRPNAMTSGGWRDALHDLEEHLPAEEDGQRVVAPGEIVARDAAGELQFLRRTPVAGAFKFEPHGHYNAPAELVDFFGKKLDEFDELIVIGYGWGDRHINTPIERWLAADPSRWILNVDPRGLNPNASHLDARASKRKCGAADYLASLRETPVSATEMRLRAIKDILLTAPDASQRFATMRAVIDRHVTEIAAVVERNLTVDTPEALQRIAVENRLDEDSLIEDILRELNGTPSGESDGQR